MAKTKIRFLGAALGAGMALIASLAGVAPAWAADPAMNELLEILRRRGSITEEEYRALTSTNEPAQTPATELSGPSGGAEDATGAPEQDPAATTSLEAIEEKVERHEARIEKTEQAVDEQKKSILRIEEIADGTSSDLIGKALEGKWYERISLRGYTQFRMSEVLTQSGPDLEVPADRSVRDNEMFLIRRGRFIFSGDASEHVFLYGQLDFNASPGAGDTALQMRDLYADIALDSAKEFRIRVGESKVPYGFVNMQSSQNRAPFERPDALNSAVEGERDLGAYLIWAPAATRQLYKDLVKLGLKGSGDYGVASIGTYAGQGLNRADQNHQPHGIARVSYPFQLPRSQILELGVQYTIGRFVSSTSEIDLGNGPITPDLPSNGAIDQRGALSAVLYPKPFGFEAEWTVGEGPELAPGGDRIEARFLHGGYVQLNQKIDASFGTLFPFVRWNYYAGGRKFATNAPRSTVNEIDTGLEYAPWPELELTLMYTHSFERTNTRSAPYDDTKNADRIGAQVQWNY